MAIKDSYVVFAGGEDLITSSLLVKPGRLRFSLNVESSIQGGIARIDGHERFDGQPFDTIASYYSMPFSAGTDAALVNEMDVLGGTSGATGKVVLSERILFVSGTRKFLSGETLTGVTSTKTAHILYVEKVSGEWEDGSATGFLYIRSANGAFLAGEPIKTMRGYAICSATQSEYTTESGSWAAGTAAGTLIIMGVSGAFVDGETVEFDGNPSWTAVIGPPLMNTSVTDPAHFSARNHSRDLARERIGVVPGSGAISGVWIYNDNIYVIRNNAAGTLADMYKATATGWSLLSFPTLMDFITGTAQIFVADTVVDGTTGAIGVVTEVILGSGTWAGGDAAGRIFINVTSGTFANGNNLEVGGVPKAVIDSVPTTPNIAASGRYEFINYNFFGEANKKKMYMVSGVQRARQFDGVTIVPIITGMPDDVPTHITAHRRHLFLSFPGGSIQHSSIGNPYVWSPVLGAASITTGDEVTAMLILPGQVMGVLNRNRTYLLYGKTSADWDFVTHSFESGGREWSAQVIGTARFLDDPGLTSLDVTDKFGGFEAATWSHDIQPVIEEKLKTSQVTASCVVRTKNQYRIFFDDGTGLYASWNGPKLTGITRVNMGKVVRTICCAEREDGTEEVYWGSDDGYIYKEGADDFAGEPVESIIRTPHYHYKTPNMHKNFHKLTLDFDVSVSSDAVFAVLPDFDYGNPTSGVVLEKSMNVGLGAGYWSINRWNEFQWSAPKSSEADLNGLGRNMALTIHCRSSYSNPWHVHGMVTTYDTWGAQR